MQNGHPYLDSRRHDYDFQPFFSTNKTSNHSFQCDNTYRAQQDVILHSTNATPNAFPFMLRYQGRFRHSPAKPSFAYGALPVVVAVLGWSLFQLR
jgi:hypothetical protein